MKKRILSGMRPTGELHLGHLLGALENWIKLQDEYKAFYMIADWHAISTAYEDKIDMRKLKLSMIADWIAAGIDPEKSVIFIQSSVKAHAELHLLLSMITPLAWVERNPTYKEMQSNLSGKNIATYGFLGYPVLQAADILIYNAECVPVGKDQLPHLELAREIVRRFNFLYTETLKEPEAILTETSKLLGLDNRKMSKSFNNYISLSEDDKSIKKKVNSMITDPNRIHKTDKGDPEVCAVFQYQKIFNKDKVIEIESECKAGTIGCVSCKKMLNDCLKSVICPIREKKIKLMENEKKLVEIIHDGNKKANAVANETMQSVKNNMNMLEL